jgi:hypothetical protein
MILHMFLLTPASAPRVCQALLHLGFSVEAGLVDGQMTFRSDGESCSTLLCLEVRHSKLGRVAAAAEIASRMKLLEIPHFGFVLRDGGATKSETGYLPPTLPPEAGLGS